MIGKKDLIYSNWIKNYFKNVIQRSLKELDYETLGLITNNKNSIVNIMDK